MARNLFQNFSSLNTHCPGRPAHVGRHSFGGGSWATDSGDKCRCCCDVGPFPDTECDICLCCFDIILSLGGRWQSRHTSSRCRYDNVPTTVIFGRRETTPLVYMYESCWPYHVGRQAVQCLLKKRPDGS